jgi:transcriptional regulator with XRE-family HTH domain
MAAKSPKSLTSLQCRAARAALKWTLNELSELSGVGLNTILRFENDQGKSNNSTRASLRRAFEEAGVEFIEDWGMGIRSIPKDENKDIVENTDQKISSKNLKTDQG